MGSLYNFALHTGPRIRPPSGRNGVRRVRLGPEPQLAGGVPRRDHAYVVRLGELGGRAESRGPGPLRLGANPEHTHTQTLCFIDIDYQVSIIVIFQDF